jgi:hypothetical protein
MCPRLCLNRLNNTYVFAGHLRGCIRPANISKLSCVNFHAGLRLYQTRFARYLRFDYALEYIILR